MLGRLRLCRHSMAYIEVLLSDCTAEDCAGGLNMPRRARDSQGSIAAGMMQSKMAAQQSGRHKKHLQLITPQHGK